MNAVYNLTAVQPGSQVPCSRGKQIINNKSFSRMYFKLIFTRINIALYRKLVQQSYFEVCIFSKTAHVHLC